MTRAINITLIILLALTMASCGSKKQEAVVEEKPTPVTVAPAAISDITVSKTYTGTLEGWKQARIYASIPEAVVDLPVRAGSEVQAGQPVIILDPDGPASQLRQARAVYEDAKDNFEKMTRLFEQGAISEQMYKNLKTRLDVAKANYEAARQQVELTSPITGILTDLSVNIGQYVPLGTPLATVAETDMLRLTIYIDGRSASSLKVGQIAQIGVEALRYSDSNIEGAITEIARSADPETRLFRVELQLGNKDHKLSPGMFARANVVVENLDDILTVPREAVFSTEGVTKVYKLEGGRAKEQTIEVGEGNIDSYHVVSGLSVGDSIIVLGRNQVADGTLVKVVEDTISAKFAGESTEG